MLCVDNCVFGGQLCDFIYFVREVACRSTCDLGSPPPALISTAQQHVYFLYLSRWSGACVGSGAHATRRQP